jgi:hypothetical protein
VLAYASLCLGYIFPANATESMSYKLARLYAVFFISGVIHMAGDAMVTGKIIFKAFTFFMLQPVGITIELLVVHLWSQVSGTQDKTSAVHRHDLNGETKSQVDSRKKSQSQMIGYNEADEPVPSPWIRCMGFIWVAFWMALTAPHIVDPLCLADVFRDPRLDLRRFMKY